MHEGARYGLRVDGPFEPAHGHRFDVSKLLADPYAAAIDRPFRLHPSMFERGVDSGAVRAQMHSVAGAGAASRAGSASRGTAQSSTN